MRRMDVPRELTFANLCGLILWCAQLPEPWRIYPDTQLERDLGITGVDGAELLRTAEEHFAAPMSSVEGGLRAVFDLKDDEFLFHGEGFSWSDLIPWTKRTQVRAFTAGELFEGLLKARGMFSDR